MSPIHNNTQKVKNYKIWIHHNLTIQKQNRKLLEYFSDSNNSSLSKLQDNNY